MIGRGSAIELHLSQLRNELLGRLDRGVDPGALLRRLVVFGIVEGVEDAPAAAVDPVIALHQPPDRDIAAVLELVGVDAEAAIGEVWRQRKAVRDQEIVVADGQALFGGRACHPAHRLDLILGDRLRCVQCSVSLGGNRNPKNSSSKSESLASSSIFARSSFKASSISGLFAKNSSAKPSSTGFGGAFMCSL